MSETKKLSVHLTFFEPYRVAPVPEEQEHPRYQSFARWAFSGAGYRIFVTGTLFRSATIMCAERLLALMEMGSDLPIPSCCIGEFITVNEDLRNKRRRPTPKFSKSKEKCQNRDKACPFCLLLGRFDKTNRKDPKNSDYDVHFSNLSWPEGVEFKTPDEAVRGRFLNRVEHFTGKAHDYFTVGEVLDKKLWELNGVVSIKVDIYGRVKDLVVFSLKFIDRLCGALCEVEVTESEETTAD
jgi:hypothetical protein